MSSVLIDLSFALAFGLRAGGPGPAARQGVVDLAAEDGSRASTVARQSGYRLPQLAALTVLAGLTRAGTGTEPVRKWILPVCGFRA
jgi:hypothetical protein